MRKLMTMGIATATLIVGVNSWADSPHFLYADSSVSSGGALAVTFKEAGLGTTVPTEAVTLAVANSTAIYQCFNNGGNHPKAGNKETITSSFAITGVFPVRNGSVRGVITAGPPGPGDFSCPPGQDLFLTEITYSGITVTGASGDSLEASPDPATATGLHVEIP